MPTIQVNGTRLYYQEAGHGQPVLFVHGMCGNANVWDHQVELLAPSCRCIAYDRRGHTRSPLGETAQRSVQLHADDAAGLIQALGLARCFLVGSSGGARVGIDVLRRYPHLIRAAALSEPPLFALDPQGAQAFMAELRPRLEEAAKKGGRAAVDAFFAYVCPGLWTTLDEKRRELYRANHEELFGDLQMPPYQLSTADLREIHVHCLILSGSESHPLLRRVARVLADNIPSAQWYELQGSGHVTYAEKPEEFARSVREYFQRSEGPIPQ